MRVRKLLQKLSPFFLLTFLLTQVFGLPLSHAQAAAISGKIEKITQLPDGQYEIIVLVGKERAKYLMDSSTVVQTLIPAEQISAGQTVVIQKRNIIKGMTGMKSPGHNLSPAVRKELGLPNIPEIPSIPQVPNPPEVPKTPEIPSVPRPPSVPKAGPTVPSVPKPAHITKRGMTQSEVAAPKIESEAPKQPSSAPKAKPVPSQEKQTPPAQAAKQEAPPKEFQGEVSEPPIEARSSVAKGEAMYQPTSVAPAVTGRKVIKVEKATEGMKLIFENKEAEVVPSAEKIVRLLQIKDLKVNMKVELEVVQDSQGKFIERVTVAS